MDGVNISPARVSPAAFRVPEEKSPPNVPEERYEKIPPAELADGAP